MRLAVVVPHHSRRDLLSRCLRALPGRQIVVVDDSRTGLREAPPGVLVERTTGEVGFASAVNLGLARAQREGATHVLLLNDDAVIENEDVDLLVDAFGEGVGAVGPLLLGADGVESAGFSLRRWGRLRQLTRVPSGPVPVDALSGACLLVSATERLDEAYRHGMEDLDLCLRLRGRGLRVVLVPAARCQHLGGATVSRRSDRAQRHAVSGHLRLVQGGWRTAPVLALALAQVLAERGPVSRAWAVAQGWRDWRRLRPPRAGRASGRPPRP